MGSEQFTRIEGIKRSAEGGQGLPEAFTVIGVDISAKALIDLYKGTKTQGYAADVVAAIVQEQRTNKPPPSGFVRTLRGGVQTPIIVCDLNADRNGKSWVVVVGGRQRTLGLRIVNAEAAERGHPPMQLACIFSPFARKTAGADAEMAKVVENARVRMSFSARAEVAAGLNRRKIPHEDIAPLTESADAEEVALLLDLDRCDDCVKRAVDAGKVLLTKVKRLAALDPIVQVQRMAKIMTPAPRVAKSAAAAKARPAAYMTALATIIPERTYDRDEVRAIVLHLAGDGRAFAEHPHLAKALESAKGAQS